MCVVEFVSVCVLVLGVEGVVSFFGGGESTTNSSTFEVDLHYMSADYQQPAKHEKSAENPILARLDLELGKPHLLDWSSGQTFF